MPFDQHRNFAYSTVATAPSPALSGTSLVVAAGDGAKFPAPPFNLTIWPTAVQPLTTNAEIVRCTAIATDTLTITRTQESSTNRSVVVGDQIALTFTNKVIADVEATANLAAVDSTVVHLAGTENITGAKTATVPFTAQALAVTGLTGATAASRITGSNTTGAPTTGTFILGDVSFDRKGPLWICDNYLYDAQVLADGAAAYWILNDSTSTAVDQLGTYSTALSGGYTQGVTGPTTDPGTATSFNGSSGYIDIGTQAALTFSVGKAFSVEFIAKIPPYTALKGLVCNLNNDGGAVANYYFQHEAAGRLNFGFSSGNVAVTTGPVDDNLYHHWVGTYDGASARLYRDSVLVGGPTAVTPGAVGTAVLEIGRFSGTYGRYFGGTLTRVAIYPKQLIQKQINDHYAKISSAFPYHFANTTTLNQLAVFNVKDARFNAKGDGRVVLDAAITTGTNIVTSATAAFTAADVTAKREVCITGAGAAGANFKGIIAGFTNSTTVTTDINAGTTVTAAFATIGTDDTAAIQLAIDTAQLAGGGYVYRPATSGLYLLNSQYSYTSPTHTGLTNLRITASNIHLISAGPEATLQQGPGGVGNNDTVMIACETDISKSVQIALTQYSYNSGFRGDPTLTLTTAGDAANFPIGTYIYIRSEPSRGSGDWAEVNIVTSSNAGTGVVGLKWQLSKDYLSSTPPYGASVVAPGSMFHDITFEHEWHNAISRYVFPSGIFNFRMRDVHFDGTFHPTGVGVGNAWISNQNYLSDWEIRNSEFTYDADFCQWATGDDRSVVTGSRFIQRRARTGGMNINFSENCADMLWQGNFVQAAGATGGLNHCLDLVETWGVRILDNVLKFDTTLAGSYGKAINDRSKNRDLVVQGNHIWGHSFLQSADYVFDSNRIIYAGPDQAVYVSGGDGGATNNVINLLKQASTGIYVDGTLHKARIQNNRIIGDSTAGQVAIYLVDSGAGITRSAYIIGNYGQSCTNGLQVANTAHEPGLYVAMNDFSGCGTPYSPASLSNFVIQNALARSKQTVAFSATPAAPDPTLGEIYAMAALTANVTAIPNPANGAVGVHLRFYWTQDGTGGRTVAYSGTNYRVGGAPAFVTTLSTVTIDDFECIDGTVWRLISRLTGQAI